MTVRGIGTDLVAVARIAAALERFPGRFADRVLAAEERALWQARGRSPAWLARRFAGKEALSKALGTGIGAEVRFHDLLILADDRGAPVVHLQGGAETRARALQAERVHLTLSDERDYALAFAVLEG